MSNLLIVVEKAQDWRAYYPSEHVIPVQTYLDQGEEQGNEPGDQVINLCRSSKYLSNGYYCSLLAEARGQRVIPSVRTMNDLARKSIYGLGIGDLNKTIGQMLGERDREVTELALKFYFGHAEAPAMERFARQLFEQFPSPILEVTFRRSDRDWIIHEINTGSIHDLANDEEDRFATALDGFSHKVWRQRRARKRSRYDMAILLNQDERLPPSDPGAIKRFERTGRSIGLDVEIITKRDLVRVGEFDALFIRATTAINDHTYRFAKKAESEGLIVIDDPDSILKCTNKVYLADLMRTHKLPTPGTRIISRDRKHGLEEAAAEFGFPLVLKIPDGSFSRGVFKVENAKELEHEAGKLFRESALLLVQEYVYTDYDWRIGVLNRKPLFACKYFMSRGHWQVYNHEIDAKTSSGDWETLPVREAPRAVVRAATKAANLIGDGFYGVDLKMAGDRVCIIEVNDNPSVELGVEDGYLGDDLYRIIMEEFVRRLERKRLGI